VGGRPAASLAAALPALSTAAGGGRRCQRCRRPGQLRRAPWTSCACRAWPARALLLADATAQGADSRLVATAPTSSQAGKSHFGFILKAMPFDAWVVVAILGLMMVLSWAIMIGKGRTGAIARQCAIQRSEAAGAPLATWPQRQAEHCREDGFLAVAHVPGGHR
jgi:biopolymer transport protein ExbB